MKEIVASPPEVNFIALQDASIHNGHFYGVLIKGNPNRSFITKDPFLSGNYRVKLAKDLTSGNAFGFAGESLKDLVTAIVKGGHQVFQFDTAKELYLWLAEGL